MIIHGEDDWASVGIFHLQTAIQIMNLLVDNDLVNREVMIEMIEKSPMSGTIIYRKAV